MHRNTTYKYYMLTVILGFLKLMQLLLCHCVCDSENSVAFAVRMLLFRIFDNDYLFTLNLSSCTLYTLALESIHRS